MRHLLKLSPSLLRCFVVCVALLGSGCATNLGSKSLPQARINYLDSIASSSEQQMLLNIVRLKNLRLPVFLQVSNVVTQYALSSRVGVSGAYNVVSPGGFAPTATVGGNAGVMVEERPTITYTPLQGDEFVWRLATPLTGKSIAALVLAGWPWDAVLACCVQQINGQFAPANAWRNPHSDFQRVATMMRDLQETHALSVSNDADGRSELVFAVPGSEQGREKAAEVRRLLGLRPDLFRYPFAEGTAHPTTETVTLHGRSMSAIFYYVSQGVEGPSRGRPDIGPDALLHVRRSDRAPRQSYASVEYEGRHYYIAADDNKSQDIFVLLAYILSFMSSPGGTPGPVLTVGAGR